jgi:hypothetical protein
MSEQIESPARPMNRSAIAAELRSLQSRLASSPARLRPPRLTS